MNKLKQLGECGQAVWLDHFGRRLIESGELSALIEQDGVTGVTSNPSIFEKAIAETDEYAEALKQYQAYKDHDISEMIYERLAIADIKAAANILRPVYDETRGRDGYISLECSPHLANDFDATVKEARRLWARVNRPNLMVKVPATPSGIPAIRQLTSDGVNVNITLIFSVGVYQQVVDAYLSGLEDLFRAGGDISKVSSVASIFVSRIDTEIDRRIDKLRDSRTSLRLRGKVGVANAKIAYLRYKALFAGHRWEALEASGAKTQRLLWASTGVKDPAYKDTKYVEALIGRDTVNTIPPATMDAFRHHGMVMPDAVEGDLDSAHTILAELEQIGVSLNEVTDELLKDGVRKFAGAFDKLLDSIARRRDVLRESEPAPRQVSQAHRK